MYESHRDKLRKAGNKLAKARKQQEEAMKEIERLVLDADKRGVSKSDISRLAGVTRQTVYAILEKGKNAK